MVFSKQGQGLDSWAILLEKHVCVYVSASMMYSQRLQLRVCGWGLLLHCFIGTDAWGSSPTGSCLSATCVQTLRLSARERFWLGVFAQRPLETPK